MAVGHVHDEEFVGLAGLAVDVPEDDLGFPDGQFVALAPHGLDQHGEMQEAAARNRERVAFFARLDAEGHVGFELAIESFLEVAGGQVLTFAGQRRVIDGEEHAQGRLVDLDARQGHRLIGIGDRVADIDRAQADHRDDVPGLGLLDLDPAELVEHQEIVDGSGYAHVAGLHQEGLLTATDATGGDPTDGDAADIFGEVQRRAEHLERPVEVDHRPRDVLDDHIVERLDISRGRGRIMRREAGLARREDIREIELFLAGTLIRERIEDLVEDLGRAGVRPVDLVDHDDRPDVARERLAQDELRLGHRPFEGVDEDEGPVGHLERPLDFSAEIGVAGRVDQVDLDLAILDRDVLGEDRDASLSLQVVGVQNALALELRCPVLAGLAEHRVNQRRLAVVNVGNNGYVTDVVASVHGFSGRRQSGSRLKVCI